MGVVVDYISNAVISAVTQLWQVFGLTFLIAYLLQVVGSRIRGNGVGKFGDIYWYAVAPGVACHETGHAMGCFVTGTKLHKFVPFCREGNTLGYITHDAPIGRLRGLISIIISAGPIWFGCIMIMLLTWLLVGDITIARWRNYFAADSMPSAIEYGTALVRAAFDCYVASFSSANVTSPVFWIWLYLVYCIASEIGLSSVDIGHMKRGVISIVLFFLIMKNFSTPSHLMFRFR